MGPGSALSRDNTARMVFNALSAVVVSYESHSVTVDGAVYSRQVVVNDADGLTLLAQRYPEQAESN
ncbi:hypothetical protein SDC9_158224 [bioreactor metagenome]|uniref:Uncharacterized protein n=1 Tax=bioreactor metagenome TaxID=1076179 RepID=A0A645F9K8_9ZZZZ